MGGLNATKVPLHEADGTYKAHRNARTRAVIEVPDSEAARDLARGALDIAYFAERWLGVRGHAGQVAWWRACAERGDDGWRPRYLTTVVSAGNRAGKTLAMAVVVLHHALYKLGVKPPKPGDAADAMRWLRAPYEWYHVGIQQEVAELVHQECVRLVTGTHRAQEGRGCPLTQTFGPIIGFDKKWRGEYLWLRIDPNFGGGNIHFRTTQDKAKALLGKDMNGISFDEAAFDLYLTTIYQEVLNLRRLSTGGPLHFISTPTEGHNDYYDLWERGNPTNPNRDPQFRSFKMSTRDNIGFGLSQQDFDAIVRQQDEYLIPQNIDGEFIEGRSAYFNAPAVEAMFDEEMPEDSPPEQFHRYAQGLDPGIAADSTWSITIDYTARPMLGVRARTRGGHQTIMSVVNMARETHLLYSQDGAVCTLIPDVTGLGGKMFRQEFAAIKPLRPFEFAGTKAKKLELLSDLKAIIDKGQLRLPKRGVWGHVRRQLLGYKLDDKHLEQDAVMTLAMAVRHATRNPENPVADPTFSFFGAD